MGGFTRLLHSGEEDEWMDEIPTVVVDPLPEEIIEKANVRSRITMIVRFFQCFSSDTGS